MPVDVIVPPLGTTVDTLILVTWYKQEGEAVVKDEPLFAVETDKATLDVEAPASGILCQVGVQAGAEVVTLTRIALIAAPGEVVRRDPLPSSPKAAQGEPDTWHVAPLPVVPLPHRVGARAQGGEGRIFISPRAKRLAEARQVDWCALRGTGPEAAIVERDVLTSLEAVSPPTLSPPTILPPTISPVARRMAEEAGLDWTQLSGSGPGGKVVREDISRLFRAEERTVEEPSSGEMEEVLEILPVTGIRAVIAARVTRSAATTAPVTLTTETDATELAALRARLITDGVIVSYNDILLAILARALHEHPRLNASWQGEVITVWKRVHIGLAVDSEQGLRVPVVRDVNLKGLEEIGRETSALIEAARQGKLPPDAMRGGTFTLTNLGMFGIDAFTPVINLPECAILGVGRIKPQPSIVDDQVVVRQKMWISLTFDHRLVDGGPAARFLQRVTQLIEKPHLLLA